MEELREYGERFLEGFRVFIKGRWVTVLALLSILAIAAVGLAYSIKGLFPSQSFRTPEGVLQVYGLRTLAIIGTVLSAAVLIGIIIMIGTDPNGHNERKKRKTLYRRGKLGYGVPLFGIPALIECLLRLILLIIEGRPNKKFVSDKELENKPAQKHVIFKKFKLGYGIPTLGLAIPFEYLALLTMKMQDNHKYYYGDLIIVLGLMGIAGIICGVIAYNNINTITIQN